MSAAPKRAPSQEFAAEQRLAFRQENHFINSDDELILQGKWDRSDTPNVTAKVSCGNTRLPAKNRLLRRVGANGTRVAKIPCA